MTIERLGPVDPALRYKKTNKTSKPLKKSETDSISVSQEAKSMSEMYKVTEAVKLSSDVRLDRIEEVKRKLEDPSYISEKVVEAVADDIVALFGLD